MKRLCTSDWQLTDNPRDRYRLDFLGNELKPLMEKYQPEQLIFLGDLTEEKDNHPASLVNEIVEFFYDIMSCGVEIIFLQGNHDFLHKGHPYFRFLQLSGGMEWIDRPTEMGNCLYLPHTRNYKEDWKGVNFEGHDYIFAHNIFTGVKANGQNLSGIPTNIFPDECCVISGDVHEPQSFDVVTYVGAPYLCDFGDVYNPRILILDGDQIKSIKVKGPQKRMLEVTWEGDNSNFFHTGNLNRGDIIKAKVSLKMEHVAEWTKIRDLVGKWAADRGFILNSIVPIVEYEQGKRAAVSSKRKNDNEYFSAYVNRVGVDVSTANTGKDLMGD